MTNILPEAFGFTTGQPIRMLVATSGEDGDGNDRTFEHGAIAVIDEIRNFGSPQGVAFTLSIEGAISNVFDQSDGMPSTAFFEKLSLSAEQIENVETYIGAAEAHGNDSDEPDHEVGDLQDILRAAFELMTQKQKQALFLTASVQNVLECGGKLE